MFAYSGLAIEIQTHLTSTKLCILGVFLGSIFPFATLAARGLLGPPIQEGAHLSRQPKKAMMLTGSGLISKREDNSFGCCPLSCHLGADFDHGKIVGWGRYVRHP